MPRLFSTLAPALRPSGPVSRLRSVVHGAGALLMMRVLGLALAYFGNLLIVRWLGAEQAGVFVYCLSLIFILAIASSLGFGRAAMRFVAQYRAREQIARLVGIVRASQAITLSASVMVSLAGVGALSAADVGVTWRTPLMLAFASVPVASLIVLNTETAIGFGWTTFAHLPDQVLRYLVMIGGIGVYAWHQGRADAADALAIMLAGNVLILAYQVLGVYRRMPSAWRVAPSGEMRLWAATSGPLCLMLMSDVLLERIDILLLGYLGPPNDVAVFNAAGRTAALAILVQYAVVVRANSTATGLFASGRLDDLEKLVDEVAVWSAWPTLLLALSLAVAGPTALRLFGPEFSRGETAFFILLGARVIVVFTGPGLLLLSMTGRHKAAMWITMSCVVLAAVLNALLIPIAGIEGAAVATSIAMVARGVALAIAARRLVGISTVRVRPLWRGTGQVTSG